MRENLSKNLQPIIDEIQATIEGVYEIIENLFEAINNVKLITINKTYDDSIPNKCAFENLTNKPQAPPSTVIPSTVNYNNCTVNNYHTNRNEKFITYDRCINIIAI